MEADIEGNLNIESLQEKQAYKEKSSTAGISISGIGLGTPNISGSAGAGKMQSDHSTVTDQAGIYAGKKGFDIKVKGNTDLKGAVIDSKASADKNKLETGTISFEDIENKAEYETSGIGISYDSAATKDENAKMGDKGLIPNIPIGSSDEATSTTKSGVAPGTITIKDKDKQKQDIRDLNRDTNNTLNKLDQIFDKDTIQEKQEMAAIFGELAYNQIHDISKRAGWKDTDPRKATLHAIVGGIMAKLGDGNFLARASGATVNELIQKELSKIKDPALHQWTSAAVGAAVGSIVGGKTGAQSGASTAAMGTKENALSENEYQAMLDKITKNHHASYEEAIFMSEARDKQWIEDNKDELPLYSNDGVNVYEPHYVGYDPRTGGKQYLSADGKKIVLKKYYGLEQFKTRIDNLDFSNVSEGAFKIMNYEIEYHGVKLQIGVIVYRHNNKNYIYQTAGMFGTDGIFPMIGTSDTTGYMYDYTGKKITGLELVEKLEGKAIVFSGSIGGIGGDVSYGGTNSIIIAGGLSTNPGVSAGVSISERVYL